MSKNPRRIDAPFRLIVSVEADVVAGIDDLMREGRYHLHRNRAEFVRQAIERELVRCQSDDFRNSTRA